MPKIKVRGTTNNLKGGATGATGNISGLTAAQNNVARQLMGAFTQAGMSRAGGAGMVGNAAQESALNANEPGGYLFQWGGSRLTSLISFAANMGKGPSDVDAQALYAVHELKTGYASLWRLLTTTNDPVAAATAICNQWERPLASAANLPHRTQVAQEAYRSLSGTGTGGTATGSGTAGGPLDALGTAATIAGDVLTGNFSDLGARFAMIGVTLIKDIALGIGDFIVIPWWHWNQRAVMYYYQEELMAKGSATWTVLPWTAAFWGFGYYLLFTDPNSAGLKPAPVRNSRLARHVRATQALPARRALIKPGDVKEKTPRKPKPTLSRAALTQTGTMRVTRNLPVKVTGEHVRSRQARSQIPIEREGTLADQAQNLPHATGSEPDTHNRAGDRSLPHSGGIAQRGTGAGERGRRAARRR